MEERKEISKIVILGIVIISLIIAGVSYLLYTRFFPSITVSGVKTDIVEKDDNVFVNYIGYFEDGRVFDTSLLSVAKDDITYKKSLSFQKRSDSDYKPFNFTVGKGQVIKGWENGILGMTLDETKVLKVPPEDGYGQSDSKLIKTIQIFEKMDMKITMNKTDFKTKFGVEPTNHEIMVKDPFWKWNVTASPLMEENVEITHEPEINKTYQSYAWKTKVIYIDSESNNGIGIISLQHLVSKSDVNNIKGIDSKGEYFLVGVSDTEITIDYNKEIVGKKLIFNITVTGIVKGK